MIVSRKQNSDAILHSKQPLQKPVMADSFHHQIYNPIFLLGWRSCTSNNFNKFTSNDGLTGSVEENLVLANHIGSVVGSILLFISILLIKRFDTLLTSIALRRADCSQAWPSARAQNKELERAYSRRLARTSSSISKAEKFAISNMSACLQDIFFSKPTRIGDCLFWESLDWCCFIWLSVNEFVVNNLNGRIILWQ